MKAPHGTSIVDVSDPARPRTLATVEVPPNTHSHKVRAANGLMLVNREAQPAHQPPAGVGGGLVIYDVSTPARPREIPLRYDPPTPWYRRGWFYAAVGTAVAAAVGVTVYELTIAPPDKVSGGVSVH